MASPYRWGVEAKNQQPAYYLSLVMRPGNVGNVDPTHSKKALNFQ